MAGIELRDNRAASAWLSAGLYLSRLVQLEASELELTREWLLAAVAEQSELPPAGVVADIGQLLLGRRFHIRTEGALDGPRLRGAIRRYEDHVLGRLVDDSRMTAAVDAIARLEENYRAAAVGYFTGSLMRRIGFDAGVAVNQGLVRRLTRRKVEEIEAEGLDCLNRECSELELIAEGYERLTVGAEEAPTLITEADVFTMENLVDLGGLAQRMAISQAVDAAEWLGEGVPPVIRAVRNEVGEVPTGMEDESTYPTGGFAAVTTVGAPENIVTSEFMYMEPVGATGSPDLFDLRWAEGELLYYTRDETVLVRRRRQVYLAIDDALADTRVKDPEARWQRIVVVLGLVKLVVQRVAELLGKEDLAVDIVFLTPPGKPKGARLEAERRLCSLLLREWGELGLSSVRNASLEDIVVEASLAARKAAVQVVLCDVADALESWEILEPDQRVSAARLDLGADGPKLLLPSSSSESEGERATGKPWMQAATGLLEYLWRG